MNPLRKWRKNQNLSATVIAHQLGVSERTVTAWEVGAFKPSTEAYDALAKIMQINVPELRQVWTNWLLEVKNETDSRVRAIAPLPPSIGLRDNV